MELVSESNARHQESSWCSEPQVTSDIGNVGVDLEKKRCRIDKVKGNRHCGSTPSLLLTEDNRF